MDFGLIILWVVIVGLWLLYKIAFLNEDYFKKRGVLYAKPKPFFGNLTKFFFNKKNFHSILTHHYKQFKSARFFGVFNLRQPVYIIRDPDLVKQITIKDFDHFTDHADFINEHVDPIFGRILLFLKGQRWKSMRSALSPIFTSSKMKMMFHILLEDAKDFTDYFLEKADKGGRVIIDGKDVMARFTVSGISHCVFGIKANCLRDKDESFYRNARNLVSLHFLMNLKIVFGNVFPRLYRLLGLKLVTDDGIRMGQEIVVDAIKYREENNIVRPDVLHLLMEVKKGNLKYEETVETEDNSFSAHKEYITDAHTTKAPIWTEPDIIAQGLMFFFAGFETTSTLLQMTAYELARNPEIQATLHEEIDEVIKNLDGKSLTYDIIGRMKFLDMVVSESLRKWPPGPQANQRSCTKPYTMQTEDGKDVLLEKGALLFLPVVGLHYDEKYWPNSKKFDPYRFSEERRDQIHPGTYLPFGIGPRACIGSRFALMEAKILIFNLLSKFRIEVCEKTPMKIEYECIVAPIQKNPLYVELIRRS